jgi:FKBP-type peptidyl-prolyl cis-trans isomerase
VARGQQRKRGGAGQGRAATEEFLEKNGRKDGVISLESGLQIKHIQEGDGDRPDEHSVVTVDQRVLLLDGKVIGDTFKDGRPDSFPLAEAVEGYQEGLQQMRVGGRAVIYCPPDLAWGKKGAGQKIPPNALLTFDVRLRAIR